MEVTDGQPADGAVDVPTDVQPWLRGNAFLGREVEQAVLEDEAGRQIPAAVHALPSVHGFAQCVPFDQELVPAAALEPHTTYVVRVLGATRSFTTGAGPSDAPPPSPTEPAIALSEEPPSYCSGPSGACIDVPADTALELTVLHAGEVDQQYLAGQPHMASLRSHDCVEIRTRDLTGRRSTPTVMCADELPHFHGTLQAAVSAGCVADADAGVEIIPVRGDGGCSAGGRPAKVPAFAWLLGLSTLAARRRPART